MPSTLIIYYLETNLICLMFIIFVLYSYARESRGLTEAKWFIASLITVRVYCISDILAAVFKNQTFAGARTVLWISNSIYITIPLVLIIFWDRYIREHTRAHYKSNGIFRFIDKISTFISLILCVFALSTPITHSIFYLDELNGYHRTIGAYLVPAYAYLFMVYEGIKLQSVRLRSTSLQIKHDANILSVFSVPCVFFSMIQVLLYGTTISQVGFTMGLMIVHMGRQRNKISRDELTGLNNRREYTYAIDRMSHSSGDAMIVMVDADDFKQINDTYGHQEGDDALIGVALILKNACSVCRNFGGLALYRYGGDEFIMTSYGTDIYELKEVLLKAIEDELEKWNKISQKPYKLSLSIGIAEGSYSGDEIYGIIHKADAAMYAEKTEKKRQKANRL